MKIEDYDYPLPAHLIAQHPPKNRSDGRLMCVRPSGLEHKKIPDIKDLLQSGDVLVLNNTRVIKARLRGHKSTGGQVEALLERILSEHRVLCQVRVSKPLKPGAKLQFGSVAAICIGRHSQFYELKFERPALDVFDYCGELPLPPYIEHLPDDSDAVRYQTVFGTEPGAVAAPTAGLHFSEALLDSIAEQGVEIVFVTLHVGAATFQPVRGEIEDHIMHEEFYVLEEAAAKAINTAKLEGRRVVAVGTTAVRTLEAVAENNQGQVVASQGSTQLFIKPGFKFNIVDALLTNFHLPKSTLMMLVSAFIGRERVLAAYAAAVDAEYRFFSYGDACWMEPNV